MDFCRKTRPLIYHLPKLKQSFGTATNRIVKTICLYYFFLAFSRHISELWSCRSETEWCYSSTSFDNWPGLEIPIKCVTQKSAGRLTSFRWIKRLAQPSSPLKPPVLLHPVHPPRKPSSPRPQYQGETILPPSPG